MPDRVKIGIIGLGAIGEVHGDTYASLGGAHIAAVCDLDAKRLAALGDKWKAPSRFTDYRELLASDIDGVSVCVSNAWHRDVAVAALEAGKHVLLEKPISLNCQEAMDICRAEAASKARIQVGMVNRQRPEVRLLRDWIEDGCLGEVYHMRSVWIRRRGVPGLGTWFTSKKASGGGPLIDLGVHMFDLPMYLSGHWHPSRISAMSYTKFGSRMEEYKYVHMHAGPPNLAGVFDVEDYSTGFVRFHDRATMSFEISWAANAHEEQYVEILGDKAGARVMNGQPLHILTEHQGRIADIAPKYDELANPWVSQMERFLSLCRGKGPPAATAAEGLTVMRLIDAIYTSSQERREVEMAPCPQFEPPEQAPSATVSS